MRWKRILAVALLLGIIPQSSAATGELPEATSPDPETVLGTNAPAVPESDLQSPGGMPFSSDPFSLREPGSAAAPTNNIAGTIEPPSISPATEKLLSSELLKPMEKTEQGEKQKAYEVQLDLARTQVQQKNYSMAKETLVGLLELPEVPEAIQRQALLELSLLAEETGDLLQAQQVLAQYLNRFPEDPTTPEMLLRQGLLYRKMGVNRLAISKFYAVMTRSLNLKLEHFDLYKRLVLRAQTEIAETYYLEGKLDEAADFFQRLLRMNSDQLNKEQIHFRLVRTLSSLRRHPQTVAKAQSFLELYPESTQVAETRFLLADALKQLDRNQEAMRQVMRLLESQQGQAAQSPGQWIYWQKKAGNDIANQLYQDEDYLSALEIYLSLGKLDSDPSWQFPVYYQIGLVYEHLEQPEMAAETYKQIIDRKEELDGPNPNPSLEAVVEMAEWRRQYLGWLQEAALAQLKLKLDSNPPDSTVP